MLTDTFYLMKDSWTLLLMIVDYLTKSQFENFLLTAIKAQLDTISVDKSSPDLAVQLMRGHLDNVPVENSLADQRIDFI